MLKRDRNDSWHRLISVDETWRHNSTMETKEESKPGGFPKGICDKEG